MCVLCLVVQLCLTLCNPLDCSPPDASVCGSLQTRILEWVAVSSSRDLPDPGTEPKSPVTSALKADPLLLSHLRHPRVHVSSLKKLI